MKWSTAAALVGVALCGGAVAAQLVESRPDTLRFAGEYGLRVWFFGDSVYVGWLTEQSSPGRIEVQAGEEILLEMTTPAGFAHAAGFAAPPARDLLLRYGADGDSLYATRIDLRTGDAREDVTIGAVDSLYVMGDVHGEFDTLTAVLRNAGLIDESLTWSGGRRHLVLAGDMMDRGIDVTRVLWFLYGLERQAAEAGGRVHVVLGNHEIMVMTGDLRYIAPKEGEIANLHGVSYARLYDPRNSLLGRWLTSKPGLVRIGDVLLAHGGVEPVWTSTTLGTFDDTLAAYTHDEAFWLWADTSAALPLDSTAFERRNAFFWEPTSVFWYRGYAESDTLDAALAAVLDHFDAAVHVVGHTPGEHVRASYGDRLILTNTRPFGNEMLLLVREGDGMARFRIGTRGPPLPVEPATSSAVRSP